MKCFRLQISAVAGFKTALDPVPAVAEIENQREFALPRVFYSLARQADGVVR
jgi:hypothetical protein